MRPILVLLLPAQLGATGCAYRTPTVSMGPRLPSIGAVATTVRVEDETGKLTDEETDALATKADAMLRGAAKGKGEDVGVVRVRVIVEHVDNSMENSMSHDGFAVFGAWIIVTGLAYTTARIAVDLEILTQGQTFSGHGQAEKQGSIYAQARKRALAAAIDRALASAR